MSSVDCQAVTSFLNQSDFIFGFSCFFLGSIVGAFLAKHLE